jgi:hypothetical protein
MFDFTAENSTNEGDFPKLSTGEFPVRLQRWCEELEVDLNNF